MYLELTGKNYIGRNGGFLYFSFVKDALDELNGLSVGKSSLLRDALEKGANEKNRDALIKKLSEALSSIANKDGYKRYKEKGITGYLYKKIVD